jgi:hypothetical protein
MINQSKFKLNLNFPQIMFSFLANVTHVGKMRSAYLMLVLNNEGNDIWDT